MRILLLMVIPLFIIMGCGGGKQAVIQNQGNVQTPPQTGDDELIFKSAPQPPAWVYNEPEGDADSFYFVGISGKFATEKDGRDDAYNNSIQNVVKYLGSFFQEKLEKIVTTYGLSSQIVDPTKAARNFQEQLTGGLAKKVKAKEWYVEQWKTKLNEAYFVVKLLSKVPKVSIDEAYKTGMDSELEALKKQRDAIADKKAKAQFENAMEAFKKAKDEGFGLEK